MLTPLLRFSVQALEHRIMDPGPLTDRPLHNVAKVIATVSFTNGVSLTVILRSLFCNHSSNGDATSIFMARAIPEESKREEGKGEGRGRRWRCLLVASDVGEQERG